MGTVDTNDNGNSVDYDVINQLGLAHADVKSIETIYSDDFLEEYIVEFATPFASDVENDMEIQKVKKAVKPLEVCEDVSFLSRVDATDWTKFQWSLLRCLWLFLVLMLLIACFCQYMGN